MSQVENYKTILEEIFGQEINFSKSTATNNCMGALMNREMPSVFKTNFIERLVRLRDYFSASEKPTKEIIDTAKQIALGNGYKWAGPYSELVALDYWIQFDDLENITFPDRGDTASFADSIAKKAGHQEIDIDISLDLATKKIYTDVKCLIPTHIELTDQILNILKRKIKRKDFLIGIDNLYNVDYLRTKSDLIYEIQSGTLIAELENCINQESRHYTHTLISGEKASFRISYPTPGKNNVLMTMREMNPYMLANDYKYKILDYYNKFLITEPSLITFVLNPWFNSEMMLSDDMFLDVTLRSLSRRIFIELTRDHTDLSVLFPHLSGKGITISDVACKVSGIIFIKDNSIKKTGREMNDVHIYLNPNATNRIMSSRDFDILNWSPAKNRPPFIDDFADDNY